MIDVNIINQYDDSDSYQKIIIDVLNTAYDFMGINNDKIINIILMNNDGVHQLNHQFRGIDKPTDVLSFENVDLDDELGDVFISIDKVKSQAEEYSHSFERELAFLTLHGFLHCLGYDHLNEKDELEMFGLQNKILNKTNYRRT
ncbi:rRNA maturation RNase YbeY [Mycoplasmatota bacterium]|nr:rRNA maturation RNase YbeY [Mycoplasmatota bacterium]